MTCKLRQSFRHLLLCKAKRSVDRNRQTFLYPLHTLDIASSNAAVIYYGLPSPVVPAAAGNPWTFPRPRKHATGMFSTLAMLGPGFQVRTSARKSRVLAHSAFSVVFTQFRYHFSGTKNYRLASEFPNISLASFDNTKFQLR